MRPWFQEEAEEAAENPNYLRYVSAAYVHVSAINEIRKVNIANEHLVLLIEVSTTSIVLVLLVESLYCQLDISTAGLKVNTAAYVNLILPMQLNAATRTS
ncbi:hypothetical protein Tco_1379000 [Tanacetum coccineum]